MGIDNYFLFLLTAFFFIMTPGIDTVFVINKSIGQGRIGGIYATLGINCGVLVHTLFAALGLSVIVSASAIAFTIIKYFGALYLIYLGISSIRSKKQMTFNGDAGKPISNWSNFSAGFITNTFNPKVALFFLSFFPQFINSGNLENALPFILLGLSYALLGVVWFFAITFLASVFSNYFKSNPKFSGMLNKISGIVYIAMGIKIALTRR